MVKNSQSTALKTTIKKETLKRHHYILLRCLFASGMEVVEVNPSVMTRCSPVCEDVLEADEGLCEGVELVHGGVDGVETRAAVWNLLTVGDGKKEPAVDLKCLPVRRSHRLLTQHSFILTTFWPFPLAATWHVLISSLTANFTFLPQGNIQTKKKRD